MRSRHLFLQLMMPSLAETFFEPLLTLVLLVGSTWGSIADRLGEPISQYYLRQDLHRLVHDLWQVVLGRLSQDLAIGPITTFLIWAGVGALAYLGIWLTLSAYLSLHNDVLMGTLPTGGGNRSHSAYWANLVGRGMVRLCAVLLLLLMTVIVAQLWYPLSVVLFGIWTSNFLATENWVYLAESVIGWIAVLHLYTVFLRLSLLRPRVF